MAALFKTLSTNSLTLTDNKKGVLRNSFFCGVKESFVGKRGSFVVAGKKRMFVGERGKGVIIGRGERTCCERWNSSRGGKSLQG